MALLEQCFLIIPRVMFIIERNLGLSPRGEEEDLVNFIEEVAEVGFGKTRKPIKAMVEQTAHEKQVLRSRRSEMVGLDVS